MEKWINYTQTLTKIASDSNLFNKRLLPKKSLGRTSLLANREARVCAPSGKDSSRQNQWAALRAAHEMASEKPKSMVLVGRAGFEPA
ncbi:MAG TPA: hypothetical protein DEB69_04235 [Candidatus Komeilibacteria bacterium]|nr:hypothetical protein [Candidatus Komeilibacteria bacterium]